MLVFIVSSQHIKLVAIMTMKLSVTSNTLRSSSWQQASVAGVALIINQVLNGNGNVVPLILGLIIFYILVHR